MKGFRKVWEVLNIPISLSGNVRLQKVLLVFGLFVIIYGLLALVSMPARLDLAVGRPSPRTIFAPRDTVDDFSTTQLREAAADAVADVYERDPAVMHNALRNIDAFFTSVKAIRDDPAIDEEAEAIAKEVEEQVEEENEQDSAGEEIPLPEELARDMRLELFQDLLPREIPHTALEALLTDEGTLEELHLRLRASVEEIFEQGVKETEIETARRRLSQDIQFYPFNPDLKRIVEILVEPMVTQNLFFNEQATEQNRELARNQVEPVVILRNTLIVSEGQPVTEKQMALLEELGLIRGQQADYAGYLGLLIFLLVIFVLFAVYISVFVPRVYSEPRLLLLMGLVMVVTTLFAVAATYFSGFLIPVAMGVILITVLFGYRLALLFNLTFALMVGLITGGQFSFVLVALLGGLVSIYAVTRLSQRSDLARAGFYVAAINVVLITANFLFFGDISVETEALFGFGAALLAGAVNGIFSSVVAIGMLPYLESLFGVTTAITLLELSNPNHLLLREMLLKAPGTYYHSMMVSNLAETAAEKVGADALLARVGAYYHDIGKLKRPYFFSENQLSGDNPHDRLSPNLSALIIGAHPSDGYERGRKHRLPETILDFTLQHHGTSMISFFYQKALERDCREEVSPEKFRYEGPRPQTKETAIVMLADSVEAGVRSLSKPSSSRVEGLVRRMIREKLDDGQLDQCDLTMRELDQIADSFVYIMSGIYHSRVEYPEKELKKELERSSAAR